MSRYEKQWPCCGDTSITDSYEPEQCPFCTPPAATPAAPGEVTLNKKDLNKLLNDFARACAFGDDLLARMATSKAIHEYLDAAFAALSHPAPVAAPAMHPATADLVRRFSDALAAKLAAAEKKYGYSDGWLSPDWMDECRAKLLEHVAKGDPRDVAAYCAFLWHHGESTAAPAPASEAVAGAPFGIIDPDYARIFTKARVLAWQYGFALVMHGSFTRDLDLLLVPWEQRAFNGAAEHVITRLAAQCDLKIYKSTPSDKPHGRKCWTLHLPGFGDPRWVDLSVMPTLPTPGDSADAPVQQAGELTDEQINEAFREHLHEDERSLQGARMWFALGMRAALKGEQPVEPSGGERGEV